MTRKNADQPNRTSGYGYHPKFRKIAFITGTHEAAQVIPNIDWAVGDPEDLAVTYVRKYMEGMTNEERRRYDSVAPYIQRSKDDEHSVPHVSPYLDQHAAVVMLTLRDGRLHPCRPTEQPDVVIVTPYANAFVRSPGWINNMSMQGMADHIKAAAFAATLSEQESLGVRE